MPRRSTGEYPLNWKEIAQAVKDEAGWQCIRCGHPHDVQAGYMLTVHHLDMNPANCEWWNLAALCQKCHLQIQHKVVMERTWMLPHSEWFKPYVAGYYAHAHGLPHDRESVMERVDWLIALGQGLVTA
jgi:5-methylcytosine-specific restriction endonuclease McrA